ncbi:MAG: hypothetical protein JWN03_8823 [Nocardia sp.]|uniref:hypothetical protein n=1 Tax=Nocardia sp. TaxID=1821 RepID=UPI00260B34E8|nr:hypothetical protein [Nocardia sp.]MCU1648548.1 hypothetical protein [Nocardia sp.]
MSESAANVLFSEPGARYRTIAYGPVLCGLILVVEVIRGGAVHWFGLVFCGLLLAGFVWLQVIAGKRHISIELTPDTLREGAETLPLSSIAAVLPETDDESWDYEDWESARALGELSGVPRRRKGIGLKLRDGGLVQAWARDHYTLRTELTAAVEQLNGAAAKPAEAEQAESDEEKEAR